MAQRGKGPGRPLLGGYEIQSKSNIPISDEMISDVLKDVLNARDSQALENLPKETLNLLYSNFRRNLLTLTDRKLSDPNQLFIGEYGDRAGVQVSFDIESFLKNPSKYISSLPRDYLKGIIQWTDIEREIELNLLKDATSANGNLQGKLSYVSQNGGSDLHLVENNGRLGRDGISDYKEYDKKLVAWASVNQVAGLREAARDGLIDESHYIFAREVANLKHNDSSQRATRLSDAQLPGAFYSNLNTSTSTIPDLDEAFSSYKSNGSYQKSLDTTLGQGYKLEDMLESGKQATYSRYGISTPHFYMDAKNIDSVLSGKISSSAPIQALKAQVEANPQAFGFSNSAIVTALFDKVSDDKISDLFDSTKPSYLGAFNRRPAGVSIGDVDRFRSLLKKVQDSATDARASMRDSLEAKFKYNYSKIVDDMLAVSGLPADEVRRKKNRLLAVQNWKDYAGQRSLMQAQEEFFTAVSKGDIVKRYIVGGRYNEVVPPIFQDIYNNVMNVRVLPGVRTIDVQRFLRKNFIERPAQAIGFAGTDITAESRNKVLGVFYSEKYDFVRYGEINASADMVFEFGKKVPNSDSVIGGKLHLFENNRSFSQMQIASRDFREANPFFSGVFNPAQFRVLAKDLKALPDFLHGADHLATNLANATGGIAGLRFIVSDLYHSNDFETAFAARFADLAGTPEFDTYKNAFKEMFGVFEKFERQGIHPDEFLDISAFLAQNKGFVSGVKRKEYALVRFMPLLSKVAKVLSDVQNAAYEYFGEKVLQNFFFKRAPIVKKAFDLFINPKYGPLKVARQIVSIADKLKIGPFLGKIFSSPFLQKFLPSVVMGASGGTAYLAVVLSKVVLSFAKGAWGALRGDIGAFYREFKSAINEVFIAPFKFVAKLYFYVTVTIILLLMLIFIGIFNIGIFSQIDRELGTDGTDFYDTGTTLPIVCGPDSSCCYSAIDDPDSEISSLLRHPSFIGNPYNLEDTTSYAAGQCWGKRLKGPYHNGLDYGVPAGTPVDAPFRSSSTCAELVAAYSDGGYHDGWGNHVVLSLMADGIPHTLYFAHFTKVPDNLIIAYREFVNGVRSSRLEVCGGDLIGYVGTTGNSTGNHLHYEVRKSNRPLNMCLVVGCPSSCPYNYYASQYCD